ncbi:MAG TPA: hypothetical protein VGP94_02650 [Tepidisphaeraceae bacterium]|nr:hypothetical protein [Tepidisphaeraceae bacterium]
MNRRSFRPIILLGLLLCGCHPNRSLPPTPQPTPVPTDLTKKINASLHSAAQYLIQHQSPDGAWRSETYGFLKDGASLTPHVAVFLTHLSRGRFDTTNALANARKFLRTVSRENLIYPVYTAADIGSIFTNEPEIRSPWLAYLRQHQLTESLDWQLNDTEYGGWSYATNPPRRPADVKNRGPWDFSNLSATLAAMEALRAAGMTDADPAISPALLFAERCQNWPPEGYQEDERFDDGGFFFSPAEPIRNKAGVAGNDRYGQRFNSYGSATVDGILLLIDCGLAPDHPRLPAARNWLSKRFDVEHNPGKFVPGNEDLRDATYFYYCRGLARVMQRLGWRYWQKDERSIDGAWMLIEALLKRQRFDGSWANTFTDGREDDPLVATPMAAEALLICTQIIHSPPSPATRPATKPTTNPTAAILKATPAVVTSAHAFRPAPAAGAADFAWAGVDNCAGGGRDFPFLQRRISRAATGRRSRPLSNRRSRFQRRENFDSHRSRQLGRRLPPGGGSGD